jgi:HD superfamily phosphohydrolase
MNRPRSPELAAANLVIEARRDLEKCRVERNASNERLAELQSGLFSAAVKELGRRWLTATVPSPTENKAIDDPIYGHIVLDKALATVVSHPLLQRLARVKQLSFSFAHFPSSRHSRLSHSLGVAKNADRALSGIFDRGVYYVVGEKQPIQFDSQVVEQRRELVRKARVAALLHDVGHGPFGHALDSYVGIKLGVERPDKRFTETYVREFLTPTLQSVQIDAANVLSILSSDRADLKGVDQLISDIIDSSLDVDRMDYLMRDAHMTGLMMGFVNTSALFDFMMPVLDQESFILAYDEQALGYMEHLILARDFMYFNCYEHPRKRAGERIFTRLVQSIVEDSRLKLSLDQIFALADEEITTAVTGIGTGNELSQRLAEELMGDLDYVCVLEVPATEKEGDLPLVVGNWLRDVLIDDRRIAYITRPGHWEEEIAKKSIGLERAWQVQAILPNPGLYQQATSATKLVTTDSEGRCQIENFFDRSRIVKEISGRMNLQMRTIMIMCPAKLPSIERDQIRNAAAALFA